MVLLLETVTGVYISLVYSFRRCCTRGWTEGDMERRVGLLIVVWEIC